MSVQTKRSPVVVVLGHVDHGKTSLLDYIRKTNRAAREHGGITQGIGAYEALVTTKEGVSGVTFIDTPGHEAFSKLRARGANVADIAILVVDGVDSVMPQTLESLTHIKDTKLPFVVAINKMDLPGVNIDRVKKDLMKAGVLFDGMGGDTPAVPISAKTGMGVPDLLETILLLAELLGLSYDPDHAPEAFCIESKKDKNGVMVSAIMKNGTLRVGDTMFALDKEAKVKALINDAGQQVKEVTPSMPFLLNGFKELPDVGVILTQNKTDKVEVEYIEKPTVLNEFFADEPKEKLSIVIKADTQGSLDALLDILSSNENITIKLAAVGDINKSDIFLAKMTESIIVGFSISIDKSMLEFAGQEKVVIKTYSLIYELLDELQEVSDLMQEKELHARTLKGEAKILANFIIDGERIAGIKMIKGKIDMKDQIEIVRNEKLIGTATIVSLKSRAKDMNDLKKNEEGGVVIHPQLDFHIGDVIKSYSI